MGFKARTINLQDIDGKDFTKDELRPAEALIPRAIIDGCPKRLERPRIKSTGFIRRQTAKTEPTVQVDGPSKRTQDLDISTTGSVGTQAAGAVPLVSSYSFQIVMY